MKHKRCNNQSQIFREITASKFEGQHVPQFSFYRYESLCHGTKTEKSTTDFYVSHEILQDFRTATSDNNFEKKWKKEKKAQWHLWFKGFTFSGAVIHKS